METAALGKLYGISRSDPRRFQPPQRRREDIIRSRMTTERAISFEKKNTELVNFCKGCGFRRSVLEKLRGSDLYDRRKIEFALNKARADGDKKMIQACTDALTTFPEHDYFILHKGDKGGKTRISPIVGKNKDQIVARMKATKQDQLVWQHLNKHFDVHRYRSDYACSLYKQYERIEELNFHTKMRCADGKYRSEIYVCRGYDKGKQLDRRALRKVSIALGHSREDTAIANYLRNI